MLFPLRCRATCLLALVTVLPSLAQEPAAPAIRTLKSGNLILDGIPEWSPTLADELARFQNVRSAAVAEWTHDSRSLYIATRFSNLTQIHRVDQPGGARRQLTFFTESPSGWSRSPVDDTIVFTMDEGGNEFTQLYRYDPATGDSTLISDGTSRHSSATWSPDGQFIAYTSTQRNGASNDVWVMDPRDPATARLVLASPDGTSWGALEFSADGRNLLIQNYTSANQSALVLVDLDEGSTTNVAGAPDQRERNLGGTFTADGQSLYYLTNTGSDFLQLARRSVSGGSTTPTIVPATSGWDVSNLVLSPDKSRGAFIVNEGGIDRLYLFDPVTGASRRVESIPVGLVGGLLFSPDNRRLALTLNTARTPSDSFVLELGADALTAGELVRWTFSEVGGLDTETFVEPELIAYPTFDDVDGAPRQIPAFMYRPAGPGPHPVIISIHGGPESQSRPGFSSTYQLWLKRLGAAVVVPNVRGSSGYGSAYLDLDNGFKREDSVRDIGALLDWIATQPDLDASRVAVFGGSYGGYMVLASATHFSDRLRAAVDVVGISNFVTFLENTQDYRRDLRRVEYGDERDPAMRAHLQAISPLTNVGKISIPMLVVQGDNDPRVPVTEAVQIVAALRAQDQTVWYMNALNEGHGYRRKENRDIYEQAVIAFFQAHLLP